MSQHDAEALMDKAKIFFGRRGYHFTLSFMEDAMVFQFPMMTEDDTALLEDIFGSFIMFPSAGPERQILVSVKNHEVRPKGGTPNA